MNLIYPEKCHITLTGEREMLLVQFRISLILSVTLAMLSLPHLPSSQLGPSLATLSKKFQSNSKSIATGQLATLAASREVIGTLTNTCPLSNLCSPKYTLASKVNATTTSMKASLQSDISTLVRREQKLRV